MAIMHYRTVLHLLGSLLVLLGILMVLPLAVALLSFDDILLESYEALGFFVSIALALIGGFALRTVFEADLSRLGHREGSAIVSLAWICFSAVGCLPYLVTGAAGPTDAFFETMSGFTTTGATIFPQVEVLPAGLQLWRHQTQWMGGMGIVVLSVAVLPLLGVGGYRMFKAEAPGGSTFERNAPRIRDTAKVLWAMYLTMSVVELLLLRLGGMSLFEATCHTFTTMSTGGFSTSSQSVAHWPSPFIQWTIVGFMLLAGCNFGVYQQLARGQVRAVLGNLELRVYLALLLLVGGLTAGTLLLGGGIAGGTEATIRGAGFSVVSVTTTTGYGTEDFDRWPDYLRLLLVLLMFVGGCAGSTAGGMKIVRLLIFVKASLAELRRSVTPHTVQVVRIGDRPLDRQVVSNIMGFLAMWLALFALGALALTLLGLDLLAASTAAASNLGNVGPGLGAVGPTANYAAVPSLGKWLLIFIMLLGRLELYSPLVLLLKRTWVH
jgi:trk system potassium uptake protein TrkH